MKVTAVSTFKSPCAMPNGLQWYMNELYVIDQESDDVFVLDEAGTVVRALQTPTENGSGITVGGGFVWTASNGRTKARAYRPTDTHLGYIYKLDAENGKMLGRWRTPDGGGIHGIEYDNGLMWVTAFNPLAIYLVDTNADFKVVHKFNVELQRLHGLALEDDGIWCAHTSAGVIIKYHKETGANLSQITIPAGAPFIHGLSIRNGLLWYADANAGEPDGVRGYPEIGYLELS